MYWLLLACLLFTFNDFLWKKYLANVLSYRLAFIRAIYTSTIMAFLYFFMDGNFFIESQSSDFYILIISCLLGSLGLFALITYLQKGLLYNLGFYNLAGVLLMSIYTYLFEREKMQSHTFIFGMICIVIGYIVFIYSQKQQVTQTNKKLKNHLLLWVMTIAFTLSIITQSISVHQFSFITVTFTQELSVAILAGLICLFIKKQVIENSIPFFSWKPIVMALVISAAVITNVVGLKQTSPIAVSIIGLLTPIFILLTSVFFLNEKIQPKQYVSFLLMLLGCYLLLM